MPPQLRDCTPAIDAGSVETRAHMGVQAQQQFACRPVGAVDVEAPAKPAGLGTDIGAVAVDAQRVFGAPALGTAGRNGAAALRLDELDASGVRKSLLRRI